MLLTQLPEIIDLSRAEPPFCWGIDIGGTGIKIGLVDEVGQTLAYEKIPTSESEGPDAALQRIVSVVHRVQAGT